MDASDHYIIICTISAKTIETQITVIMGYTLDSRYVVGVEQGGLSVGVGRNYIKE